MLAELLLLSASLDMPVLLVPLQLDTPLLLVPLHRRIWPEKSVKSWEDNRRSRRSRRSNRSRSLGQSSESEEELDMAGGKGLINGTLLVLSADGFRSTLCAVVSRREAARKLGDGSIFASFSCQDAAEIKSARHAADGAQGDRRGPRGVGLGDVVHTVRV